MKTTSPERAKYLIAPVARGLVSAVAVVLVAAACSGDVASEPSGFDESSAELGGTESPAVSEVPIALESVEFDSRSGSCLSNTIHLSEFALRIGGEVPSVDLVLKADGVEYVRDGYQFDGRGAEFAFGIERSSAMEVSDIDVLEIAWSGEMNLEAELAERMKSDVDLLIVGRQLLVEYNLFAGIFEFSESTVLMLNTCTGDWVDVTVQMDSVAAELGVVERIQALELAVSDRYGGPSRTAVMKALTPVRVSETVHVDWSDRPPSERGYLNADLPAAIGEQLVAVRVHIGVAERPGAGDDAAELLNYAVCPVQATARTGFCISFNAFASTDDVLLEVPALPSEALEFWLVDERDLSASEPVGILATIQNPADGAYSILLGSADDGIRVAGYSIGAVVEPANEAWLEDPFAYGLTPVGGFDPSWVG